MQGRYHWAGAAKMLLKASEILGIEKAQVLERAGIKLEDLPPPDKRIAWEQLVPVVTAALELTEEPCIGLMAGTLWRAPACGLSSAYYLNLQTSRMSQKFAYETLWPSLSNLVRFWHEDDGETVLNRGELQPPVEPAAEPLLHMFLGIHLAGYRGIFGDHVDIGHVALKGTAIGTPEHLSALVGVRVLTGQEGNWVAVPRTLVDSPMALADPWLRRQLQPQMDAYLRSLDDGPATARALRSELANAFDTGTMLDLGAAARSLQMKPRTLRAKLAAEGVSFKAVLDTARKERALIQLAVPGTKLASVASQLGFSDYAAFTRAFRRWTGCSPTEWLERGSGGDVGRKASQAPAAHAMN